MRTLILVKFQAWRPEEGLVFRGVGVLPFGAQIRPVRDLIDHLLAPATPAPLPLLAGLDMV